MKMLLDKNYFSNNFLILVRKLKWIIFVLILTLNQTGRAQSVSVNSKADTTQIRIGEQFHLNLSATVPSGNKVTFPVINDSINQFDLVAATPIDTVISKDSKSLTLHQQFTLTCFDSGFFVIPPFTFIIQEGTKTDSLSTEAALMTVITIPVDTTKEIRAIKNILDVPFPWQDYVIYFLLAGVVAALVIILYKKMQKKKPVEFKPRIPDRPAHEIALEGLRRIESEKIWQQGFTKRYFSELTDVIRQYIERRFEIYAMEQTSDEILHQFDKKLIKEEEKEKLRYILLQADMVKFAKAIPLPSENETAMAYAYDFINMTKPLEKSDITKKEVNA